MRATGSSVWARSRCAWRATRASMTCLTERPAAAWQARVREEFKPYAVGQIRALDAYLALDDGVTWTYLSPPPVHFAPGERTGHYRTGLDRPVVGDDGQARISYEDYASALVDEIETPRHLNRRFTVGY